MANATPTDLRVIDAATHRGEAHDLWTSHARWTVVQGNAAASYRIPI